MNFMAFVISVLYILVISIILLVLVIMSLELNSDICVAGNRASSIDCVWVGV